jgi:glyoxylase-like metal-dependent hydrolase (beta-lactamase superfamily II)
MTKHYPFTKGLHEIAPRTHAYLQPDGGWGYSNAGLIVSDDEVLLVDTLFTLDLTEEMLSTIRGAIPDISHVDWLVNTHANGDHCYGNQLLPGSTILSSDTVAVEVKGDDVSILHSALAMAGLFGVVGSYVESCFGSFDTSDVILTPPQKTFSGELSLSLAGRPINLIELGPAHTAGDVVVHVPDVGVLYSGDLLFIGVTPIVWAGPISHWIEACDAMVALDPQIVVPGHGPITDQAGIHDVRRYLEFIEAESRLRFERGMTPWEATLDIELGVFEQWLNNERIAVNVAMAFHEFDPVTWSPVTQWDAFTDMALYAESRSRVPA